MSTVWHTSDIHGWHRRVSILRGFGDPELLEAEEVPNDAPEIIQLMQEHMDALATNWCATVRPEDLVWVHGDLALSQWLLALEWLAKLPGRKRFLWGNHDKGHPGINRKAANFQARYREVFEFAELAARVRYDGETVLLSHFPYDAEREEYASARYPQWRLPDEGAWLLHGHTHLPERITSDHEIHVGLDAWGLTPVNADALIAIMRGMT